MSDFLSRLKKITWRSPKGTLFTLKTTKSGYKRKHIGEIKENPKTTSKSSVSTHLKAKGSHTSYNSGVSSSQSTKIVGDSNDTFNDMGVSGRDAPLDFLFIGKNHDIEAERFTKALCEIGKSRLRLAYGGEFTVNVLDFEVENDLIENINLTKVSVNFHETSNTTYPTGISSGVKQIKKDAAKTNTIVANTLANAVDNIKKTQKPSRLTKFSDSYTKMMTTVSDKLSTANDVTLNSIMTDALGQDATTNALTMTSQMQIVMYKAATLGFKAKNPDTVLSLSPTINSGMGAWQSLIASLIINSTPVSGDADLSNNDIDKLIINDATATSALAGLSQAAAEADYTTRKEATETATSLIELEDAWTNHVEEQSNKITDLSNAIIRDSGINELVASASNAILERSYELKVEKTIVLSEDKAVIDIAYEYYSEDFAQNPDNTINYLITSNNLIDEEFFLVPKGSEIKVYV